MVVAQSWDQSRCHVAWIITSTTGMDLMPKRGTGDILSIHLVSNLMFSKRPDGNLLKWLKSEGVFVLEMYIIQWKYPVLLGNFGTV